MLAEIEEKGQEEVPYLEAQTDYYFKDGTRANMDV